MLRCRCATLSTLRHAEEAWLHRTVLERGSEPLGKTLTYVWGYISLTCYIAPFYRSAWHSSRLFHNHRATDDCWYKYRSLPIASDKCFIEGYRSRWRCKTTDDCFIEDYTEFRKISNARIDSYTSRHFSTQWRWTGFLHMHPDLDIPESLLQGPWTPCMVEYLFWLIRADAKIRWTESTSGEVWIWINHFPYLA